MSDLGKSEFPAPGNIMLSLLRVLCTSGDGCSTVEGVVVDGTPICDYGGPWDLDDTFTVLEDDGSLVRVNGWCCEVDVLTV